MRNQVVSDKTFEKIKGLKNHKDYSYGWAESRYCVRCNEVTFHSVYLTKHIFNKKRNYLLPTKIGFYTCDVCGNFQRG